jgi:S-adenosylmethionine:tRNA ribosyltransferase-isomerase
VKTFYPRIRFRLPEELSATEPPEARGAARDAVRLLVAEPGRIRHAQFRELSRFLRPGDLLVVNTSATLAAAVDGRRVDRRAVVTHFSTAHDDATWVVELRKPEASGPIEDAVTGETVTLRGGGFVTLVAPFPDANSGATTRLWRAHVAVPDETVERYLARNGRPITYKYIRGRFPLSEYQSVFGREPGSAEMPSAGRPFSDRLVTDLVARGIGIAPVLLHSGVSSLEAHEPPQAERFRVSPQTARVVNLTRRNGGRIVAVGTTVTRALETVAERDGAVNAGEGWTGLVLGPDRPARVVNGLVTGWHAPDASHLLLLEAVAGTQLVQDAYDAALDARYLWHEFGDSCLLLPMIDR